METLNKEQQGQEQILKDKVFIINSEDNCGKYVENINFQPMELGNKSSVTKKIESNGHRKGVINYLRGKEPIEYFLQLANETMFTKMLDGTNKHLKEWLEECEGLENETEPILMSELKTFVGLLLHMGTIQLNRMVDYWRVDSLFNISCYPLHMTRNRFLIILKSLQFSYHGKPLENIQDFLDHFNETMDEIYNPGKYLMIKEPLVYTQGCLRKKNIQGKMSNFTLFHSLTDIDGVTLHCLVTVEKEVGDETVMALINSKLNKDHCVYLSLIYCSPSTATKLKEKDTKCVGFLGGCDTRYKDLNSAKDVTFEKGVSICKMSEKERQLVYFTTERFNKDLLSRYYLLMTNDEHHEELMSYYTCDRRPMQMEKKIGIHAIQLMLMNAYYMYSMENKGETTLYDFRLQIIRSLLSWTNPSFERLNPDAHFPARLKPDEKGKSRRKKCRVCYQNGRRRDSLHYCPSCPQMPGLCLDNCFLAWHQLLSTHS